LVIYALVSTRMVNHENEEPPVLVFLLFSLFCGGRRRNALEFVGNAMVWRRMIEPVVPHSARP
jgi:hypothetical protein